MLVEILIKNAKYTIKSNNKNNNKQQPLLIVIKNVWKSWVSKIDDKAYYTTIN